MHAMTSPQTSTSEGITCPLSGEVFSAQRIAFLEERAERVRQRCAEQYSSAPSWRKRLERNPDYFKTFSPGGIH